MLRWGWGKKKPAAGEEPAVAPPAPAETDEWAFLRAQADHDADEMASVRSEPEAEDYPGAAPAAPEAAPSLPPVEPGDASEWESLLAPAAPPVPEPAPEPAPLWNSAVSPAPFVSEEEEAAHLRSLAYVEPENWETVGRRANELREPRESREPREPMERDDPGATRIQPVSAGGTPRSSLPPLPEVESVVLPSRLALRIVIGGATRFLVLDRDVMLGRPDEEAGYVPEVDLTPDDAVSRRHARIRVRDGRASIEDLDSTNGTALNGAWLDPGVEAPLAPGDEIELGELVTLYVQAAPVETELTEEDMLIGDLLQGAMDLPREPISGRGDGPAAAPPAPVDLLDLALEAGEAAGLLPNENE